MNCNKKHFSSLILLLLLFVSLTNVSVSKASVLPLFTSEAERQMYFDSLLLNEAGENIDYEDLDSEEQLEAYRERYGNRFNDGITGSTLYTMSANLPLLSTQKLYTLNNLTKNRVIQAIAVGSTYLYATQHEGGTVYIHRYLKSNTSNVESVMTITNAGHGTTCVSYNNPVDNETYLLVCSKAKVLSDNSISTIQIGRVKYQPGVTIDATSIDRFCNFQYATGTGALPYDYNKLVGVVANVSRDRQYIYFRIKYTDSSNRLCIQHTIYDFYTFNQELDNCNSSHLRSFVNNTTMQNACEVSITHPHMAITSGDRRYYYHSEGTAVTTDKKMVNLDGLDVDPVTTDLTYVSPSSRPFVLSYMNSNTQTITSYRYKTPGYHNNIVNNNPGGFWEAEGIQINANAIYIGLSPKERAYQTTYNGNTFSKVPSYIFKIDPNDL